MRVGVGSGLGKGMLRCSRSPADRQVPILARCHAAVTIWYMCVDAQ